VRDADLHLDARYPDETPAERRSRMTAIYDRAVTAAEDAEHSNSVPV